MRSAQWAGAGRAPRAPLLPPGPPRGEVFAECDVGVTKKSLTRVNFIPASHPELAGLLPYSSCGLTGGGVKRHVEGTCRVHAGYVQGMCRVRAGYVQGTCRVRAEGDKTVRSMSVRSEGRHLSLLGTHLQPPLLLHALNGHRGGGTALQTRSPSALPA